jgi:hypothetical protein
LRVRNARVPGMAWGRHEMKGDRRFGWALVGVGVAAVIAVAVLVPALVASAAEPCCFTNDRYEGVCTVIAGASSPTSTTR